MFKLSLELVNNPQIENRRTACFINKQKKYNKFFLLKTSFKTDVDNGVREFYGLIVCASVCVNNIKKTIFS